MATMHEKLVDMLSTIREIRENIKKTSKIGPYRLGDRIGGLFDKNHEISQRELFKKFPAISPRTMRRHLQQLLDQGIIIAKKNGRKVVYAGRGHLSTKPLVDEPKPIW